MLATAIKVQEAEPVASPLACIDLPLWANSDYARQLLERLIVERPDRTRVIYETMTGPAAYGFAGRSAAQLRAVFEVFADDRRVNWVGAAEFNSPLYHKRRNALIAYEQSHGADALIARCLEATA